MGPEMVNLSIYSPKYEEKLLLPYPGEGINLDVLTQEVWESL